MAGFVLAAAVVLAIIANVIIYAIVTGPIGESMLMCSDCDLEPPVLDPMSVGDPILFTAIFGTGAVVVYSIVRTYSARPLRSFAVLALFVLVASLMLPLRIPSPPVESNAKLSLITMHVVGYVVILGTLWFGHQRGWLTSQSDQDANAHL
jgi:Family of unknown function (DUF6069)